MPGMLGQPGRDAEDRDIDRACLPSGPAHPSDQRQQQEERSDGQDRAHDMDVQDGTIQACAPSWVADQMASNSWTQTCM